MPVPRDGAASLNSLPAAAPRLSLIHIYLDSVDAWYREKAPRDALHLNVMKRYQYFTQAMAELSAGKPDAALLTLAPLERSCQTCARYIAVSYTHLWSWWGLSERAEWCAMFLSWCADQAGLLDTGAIPKFENCVWGANWFKDNAGWADGSAEPSPGDIIFFDWEPDLSLIHIYCSSVH